MMINKLATALLPFVLACVGASAALADDDSDAEPVELAALAQTTDPTFEFVSASGNGCPSGSTLPDTVPERSATNVLFDSFNLATAAGSPRDLSCTLTFKVTAKNGLPRSTFGIQTQLNGAYAEDSGASGTFSASYAFSGAIGTRTFSGKVAGKTNAFNHEIKGSDFAWSGCPTSGTMKVTLRATVAGPVDQASIDLVALDGHSGPYLGASSSSRQCRVR